MYHSGRDGAERLPKKLLAARLEARESFESRTDLPPAGTVYAAETCSRARNTASCVLVDTLVDHVHVRLICNARRRLSFALPATGQCRRFVWMSVVLVLQNEAVADD